MLKIFKRHPYLAGAFALASLLVLGFAASLAYKLIFGDLHGGGVIQPWMTVGYIGRGAELNPRVIDEAAGLPLPVNGRPFTLQEIADQRGVPVSEVIAQVEAAIAKLKGKDAPK
jgi:hypothetical protein